MKTITFSLLIYFLFSVPFAIAQNADKEKLSDTVPVGINMQNLTGKNPDGTNLNYKSKTGYLVGVNVYIPIVPMFFFQPGLLSVSYTHLRAHETRHDLVCRLLLEKKK